MNTTKPLCNLHLLGLRHLDGAILRVFLQLLEQNHQTRCHWVLNETVSPDLVLAPPQNMQARQIRDAGIYTAWVVAHNETAPADGRPVLRRPLQMEDLLRILESASIYSHPPTAPQKPAEELPTLFPSAGLGPESSSLIHLHGWPPAPLLAMHPSFGSLASLLLGQFLTPHELVARSEVPWEVCSDFLDAVYSLGYLDIDANHIAAHPSGPAGLFALRHNHPAHPDGHFLHGLLGRLRHRIGRA